MSMQGQRELYLMNMKMNTGSVPVLLVSFFVDKSKLSLL